MNDTELQNEVLKEMKRLFDVSRGCGLIPDAPVKVSVLFDLRGHTGGWAIRRGTDLSIRFNMDILRENSHSFIREIVPHEVAHIITYIMGLYDAHHGKEWQDVCWKIGYAPSRCHNFDTTPARKSSPRNTRVLCEASCGCQTYVSSITLKKVRVWKCGKHNVDVTLTPIL